LTTTAEQGRADAVRSQAPPLQHHFDTPAQQFDAAKFGVWLFLATEILLFGGLFVAYSVYRGNHPEIFAYAHQFLDRRLGALNTVILLCSSLTMAWAVRAAQLGQRRLMALLLGLTLFGGAAFMGVKYFEYKAKFEHGLLWARKYVPQHAGEGGRESAAMPPAAPGAAAAPAPPAAPTPQAPEPAVAAAAGAAAARLERTALPPPGAPPRGLLDDSHHEAASHDESHADPGPEPANAQLFFSIYFLMTGLHGLHVLAGMAAIGWLLARALGGAFGPAYFTPVDLVGLYWHLVDLIWIFLFPLLYLIR
jgi:cytochrome c oxidase subunit 3